MGSKLKHDTGGQTIQAVESAFTIIRLLESRDGATIQEIATELGLAKSTAYVYVRTLKNMGYIIKLDDYYYPSIKFLEHGCKSRQRLKIYQSAKQEIGELADDLNELVSLGIEENGQRVVIYRREGAKAVYDRAPTGEYTHLHWTGLGKAILAYLPKEYVREIIDEFGLPQATENTITDEETLQRNLETIREQGYAIGDEEREIGLRSVGIPIVCNDTVKGALAVAGPKKRIQQPAIETEIVPRLENSVNIIELKMKHY